jgi:dihydroorotase
MLGLETALALAITELDVPIGKVVALLSWQPAAIAGVADRHGRPVVAGEPANLAVWDPSAEWTVVPAHFASKSLNTPYAGRALRGKVRHTVFGGEVVVADGVAQR